MRRSISPTLDIREVAGSDKICCTRCGYALAPVGKSWKFASVVSETPTEVLAYEPTTGDPAETILRMFVCCGCGALLDTETALPNEPFLDDIVTT
jgi:acetone carboxylase gamma subunit